MKDQSKDDYFLIGRYGIDTNWSETGDRYLLKLFRDYVFHQQDANGRPMIEMGFVIETLNKVLRINSILFALVGCRKR
jgi:hypothetical protein